MVLGPAEDGGYYLVGVAKGQYMSADRLWRLFCPVATPAIEWGTSAVLQQQEIHSYFMIQPSEKFFRWTMPIPPIRGSTTNCSLPHTGREPATPPLPPSPPVESPSHFPPMDRDHRMVAWFWPVKGRHHFVVDPCIRGLEQYLIPEGFLN